MISKFTLVEILADQDGHPTVQPWSVGAYEQPGLDTTHRLLGVTMTDSDYQEPVAVMRRGKLRAVTEQGGETWAVGESLWGASGGAITNVRPDAPFPLVVIGTIYEDEGAGASFAVDVDVRVLPSLGELSGVKVENPSDLDVFIYDSGASVWEPRRLVGEDVSYTPSGGLVSTDVQAAIDELEATKTGRRWSWLTGD